MVEVVTEPGGGTFTLPRSPADYSQDDCARLLINLRPTGDAWPDDDDAVQVQAMRAAAATVARVHARAHRVVAGIFPGAPTDLLPEWEASLGLPDPCAGDDPTIAVRQRQVRARLGARGGQTKAYYIAVAAALGYAITIREFKPSRSGSMRSGDPVAGAGWAHAWQVTGPASTVIRFRSGTGRSGDRLSSFGSTVLECTLNSIKPAHTELQFVYVDATAA